MQQKVKNIGSSDAGASKISFYLSKDDVLNTKHDKLILTKNISALASSQESVQGKIRLKKPIDKWYLIAVADGTNTNVENNKLSNTAVIQLQKNAKLIIIVS
jgi:hypothetical protein